MMESDTKVDQLSQALTSMFLIILHEITPLDIRCDTHIWHNYEM